MPIYLLLLCRQDIMKKIIFMENVVYHYCSPEVFKKIIENKSIRLSDITESNDSKEIVFNNDFIKEYLQIKINAFCNKNKINKENKEKLTNIVFNHFNSYFENFYYKAYACCFSFEEDLLSQWRGYAEDAKGFAIGFDLNELKKIGKPDKDDPFSSDIFDLGDVYYSEKDQKSRIKLIINELFKWLSELYLKEGFNLDKILADVNIVLLFLYKNCIFYKNVFFKEEKEWRLCFCASSNTKTENIKISNDYYLSELSYFLRGDRLISYIDLNFEKHPEIIKHIVVGPKNNSNMIEDFVKRNEINCEIVKSKGTYR